MGGTERVAERVLGGNEERYWRERVAERRGSGAGSNLDAVYRDYADGLAAESLAASATRLRRTHHRGYGVRVPAAFPLAASHHRGSGVGAAWLVDFERQALISPSRQQETTRGRVGPEQPEPLLTGPPPPGKKITLVLDLDETLIKWHQGLEAGVGKDVLYLRPGLAEFLKEAS